MYSRQDHIIDNVAKLLSEDGFKRIRIKGKTQLGIERKRLLIALKGNTDPIQAYELIEALMKGYGVAYLPLTYFYMNPAYKIEMQETFHGNFNEYGHIYIYALKANGRKYCNISSIAFYKEETDVALELARKMVQAAKDGFVFHKKHQHQILFHNKELVASIDNDIDTYYNK